MKRLAFILVLAGCPHGGDRSKPHEPVGSGSGSAAMTGDASSVVVVPPAPPVPDVPAGLPALSANPHVTPEAVAFGQLLFNDVDLSQNASRSCFSCHDPEHGYSGKIKTAFDGKENLRRTPALVNLAWVKELGWDGRYPSVAALIPPHLKGQLGDPIETVAARIDAKPLYHAYIAALGGTPRDAVVQALEAFVLTRYEGSSPWDRVERSVLSTPGAPSTDPVVAGYQLFMGKAQCGVCHTPPLYTDGGYHAVEANPFNDPGNKGAFRTPTLRGAAHRIAFFHTGAKDSLADVIGFYAQGANGSDPIASKIRLTPDEQAKILAFVHALTAEPPVAKPVTP